MKILNCLENYEKFRKIWNILENVENFGTFGKSIEKFNFFFLNEERKAA